MKPRYESWTVRVTTRPAFDYDRNYDPVPLGYTEPVVLIFEKDRRWEVSLDNAGRIQGLAMCGKPIDQKSLREVPLGYLRDMAASALARVDASYGAPGSHLDDSLREGAADPGEVKLGGPTLQEFASLWLATPQRDPQAPVNQRTRRAALAAGFGVSLATVDKWTRQARDRGLLPPPAHGGGPKSAAKKGTKK